MCQNEAKHDMANYTQVHSYSTKGKVAIKLSLNSE